MSTDHQANITARSKLAKKRKDKALTMKIPNWLGFVLEKTVLRKKLITLAIHYERSYIDGEQIYESFARQFFNELDDQVKQLRTEVEKDLGKPL